MAHFDFRAATPDDAPAVAAYHDRCFRQTYKAELLIGQLVPSDVASTCEQLCSWFRPGSGFETTVATAGAGPIGHVTVNGHQLVHLFVEPDHHGSGLGRRLLEHGESVIASRGYASFELHTRVDNTNGIAFYKAMGWTLTDEVITTVEHGISYDEHVFAKHRQPAH